MIGSIGSELDKEIQSFGDILRLNFTESHYLLPMKDIAFLNYIQESCPRADFVFKGDDDILVMPENIGLMVREMVKDGTQALGYVVKNSDTCLTGARVICTRASYHFSAVF